jgi:hypothetical protein
VRIGRETTFNEKKDAWPLVPVAAVLLPAVFALDACGTVPADTGWSDGGGASGPSSNGGASGSSGGGDSGSASPLRSPDGGLAIGSRDGAGTSPDGNQAAPCSPLGSTRSCFCGTGTQACTGASTEFTTGIWGPCLDGTGATVTSCPVLEAGCGNMNELDASCDAPPPPPDGGCGPGMICKPGRVRYCDVTGMEWTKSECDSTGNWGPCLPTIAPVGAGCDPASFQPELCCPPLQLCCQDNPGGPWKDWSSGACAAIGCP